MKSVDPNEFTRRYEEAWSLTWSQESPEGAVEAFESLVRDFGSEQDGLSLILGLGVSLFFASEFDRAGANLQSALESLTRTQKYSDQYLGAGLYYMQYLTYIKKIKDALVLMAEVDETISRLGWSDLDPAIKVDVVFGKAVLLLSDRQHQAAIDIIRDLLQNDEEEYFTPGHVHDLHFVCGNSLIGLGRYEEAVREYELVWPFRDLHRPKKYLELLVLKMRAHRMTQDYHGVLTLFSELSEKLEEDESSLWPEAFHHAGAAHYHLGDLDQAWEFLIRADRRGLEFPCFATSNKNLLAAINQE